MKAFVLIFFLIQPFMGLSQTLARLDNSTVNVNLNAANHDDSDKSAVIDFIHNHLLNRSNKYIYISCNANDMYYESDTIRIRQITKNYYPVWECCEFVEWNIISDGEFLWSDVETCEEKAQRSYYLNTTRIKADDQGNDLYLTIQRNGHKLDRFKVLGVEKVPVRHSREKSNELILLRQ